MDTTVEPPEKPYLVKVDLSSVLNSKDAIYTILVNPTEMMLIFQFKNWIKFLFDLEMPIRIRFDTSYVHDLESITVLLHLSSPARVEFGGKELKKDYFLTRLNDPKFSSLPPSTKKRILEAAKCSGVTFEDFSSSRQVSPSKSVSFTPRKINVSVDLPISNLEEEKPVENGEVSEKDDVISELDDTVRNKNNQQMEPVRKRVRPLSLGSFLNELRETVGQSCSEESMNCSAELSHQGSPTDLDLLKPQKRKRVRRHKSKKSQSTPCEEAAWVLPPPPVFERPSSSQHIRFDEENPHVEEPSMESNTVQDATDVDLTGNKPDSLIELAPSADLQLLFSLKNTFGSPPVFVRNGGTPTEGFYA